MPALEMTPANIIFGHSSELFLLSLLLVSIRALTVFTAFRTEASDVTSNWTTSIRSGLSLHDLISRRRASLASLPRWTSLLHRKTAKKKKNIDEMSTCSCSIIQNGKHNLECNDKIYTESQLTVSIIMLRKNSFA